MCQSGTGQSAAAVDTPGGSRLDDKVAHGPRTAPEPAANLGQRQPCPVERDRSLSFVGRESFVPAGETGIGREEIYRVPADSEPCGDRVRGLATAVCRKKLLDYGRSEPVLEPVDAWSGNLGLGGAHRRTGGSAYGGQSVTLV